MLHGFFLGVRWKILKTYSSFGILNGNSVNRHSCYHTFWLTFTVCRLSKWRQKYYIFLSSNISFPDLTIYPFHNRRPSSMHSGHTPEFCDIFSSVSPSVYSAWLHCSMLVDHPSRAHFSPFQVSPQAPFFFLDNDIESQLSVKPFVRPASPIVLMSARSIVCFSSVIAGSANWHFHFPWHLRGLLQKMSISRYVYLDVTDPERKLCVIARTKQRPVEDSF